VDDGHGRGAGADPVVDTVSATAAAPNGTTPRSDPRAALGSARAELLHSIAKARLERDPLGAVLEAFGTSLGAMGELLEHVEASRQPMGAKEWADMTRRLVQACRADFVRQAGAQSRRLAVLSGVGAAVLLLGALGGGYLWGRSTEAAEVREASGVIRAALSDGSASAQVWADAIRRNDLVGLLGAAKGAPCGLMPVAGGHAPCRCGWKMRRLRRHRPGPARDRTVPAGSLWRCGARVLRLLLAPVTFLGRQLLRVLLAYIAGFATLASGYLFSVQHPVWPGHRKQPLEGSWCIWRLKVEIASDPRSVWMAAFVHWA
jgi:hypothetical protein